MLAQHLAQHLANVAAGIKVVADQGYARGRQPLPADCEQTVARVLRHPGINAVSNDVIELARLRAQIAQITGVDFDVAEAQGANVVASEGYRRRSQVDAQEAAAR